MNTNPCRPVRLFMYIIIVGCGRLGSTLAQELSVAGHDVSVIDRDSRKLAALGSGFNGMRIRGVEFDCDNLSEAGIDRADCVISVTPDDNINITVSLTAKNLFHVPRIIARICEPGKKYIYDTFEIETVNPTRLSVDILMGKIEDVL